MLLNKKILISIIFLLSIIIVGFNQIDSFLEKKKLENEAYYSLGQLVIYNQKIDSYFDGKIKIENYDLIEKEFFEASILVGKLQKSPLDKDLYAKQIQEFERLYTKKDMYKALSSQIVMSLMILKDIALESKDSAKLEVFYKFLEYGVEQKKDFDSITLSIDDLQENDVFKKHSLLIIENLKQLQTN